MYIHEHRIIMIYSCAIVIGTLMIVEIYTEQT